MQRLPVTQNPHLLRLRSRELAYRYDHTFYHSHISHVTLLPLDFQMFFQHAKWSASDKKVFPDIVTGWLPHFFMSLYA